MKRFLILFALLALLVSSASAVTPYDNSENSFVYFGTIPLANDTVWHPGIRANDGWPAMRGICLDGYAHLGYEFQLLRVDSTLIDSILVDLYTGHIGGVVDSMTLLIPADSIPNGVFADAAASDASAKKWIPLIDSSGVYWFQRYVWWGIRALSGAGAEGDTTLAGVPDQDIALGDSDPSSGSGIHDWFATNGDDSWETEVDGTFDSAVYVVALGSDSTFCMFETPLPVPVSPGTFDSVVYTVYCRVNADVVTACSLRMGIAVGDTQYYDVDSLTDGYGAAVVWSAAQVVPDAYAFGYLRFKFTTDPRSRAWERSWLANDSVIVILDACHIDTVAAGTNGPVRVYTVADTLYAARSAFTPTYQYRLGVWLKE